MAGRGALCRCHQRVQLPAAFVALMLFMLVAAIGCAGQGQTTGGDTLVNTTCAVLSINGLPLMLNSSSNAGMHAYVCAFELLPSSLWLASCLSALS